MPRRRGAGLALMAPTDHVTFSLETSLPSVLSLFHELQHGYEEETGIGIGKDYTEPGLEEGISRSACIGSAVEGRQGCCHLPQRPHGQRLLCTI